LSRIYDLWFDWSINWRKKFILIFKNLFCNRCCTCWCQTLNYVFKKPKNAWKMNPCHKSLEREQGLNTSPCRQKQLCNKIKNNFRKTKETSFLPQLMEMKITTINHNYVEQQSRL
jgi:hypothetical protein